MWLGCTVPSTEPSFFTTDKALLAIPMRTGTGLWACENPTVMASVSITNAAGQTEKAHNYMFSKTLSPCERSRLFIAHFTAREAVRRAPRGVRAQWQKSSP